MFLLYLASLLTFLRLFVLRRVLFCGFILLFLFWWLLDVDMGYSEVHVDSGCSKVEESLLICQLLCLGRLVYPLLELLQLLFELLCIREHVQSLLVVLLLLLLHFFYEHGLLLIGHQKAVHLVHKLSSFSPELHQLLYCLTSVKALWIVFGTRSHISCLLLRCTTHWVVHICHCCWLTARVVLVNHASATITVLYLIKSSCTRALLRLKPDALAAHIIKVELVTWTWLLDNAGITWLNYSSQIELTDRVAALMSHNWNCAAIDEITVSFDSRVKARSCLAFWTTSNFDTYALRMQTLVLLLLELLLLN